MDAKAYDHNLRCLVRLKDTGAAGEMGTGFFVGPGLVLTAGHVVPSGRAIVWWKGHEYRAETQIALSGADVALLRIPVHRHPVVKLGPPPGIRDHVHFIGFPVVPDRRDAQHRETVTGEIEDDAFQAPHAPEGAPGLLKVKEAVAVEGMSGSPLVHDKTMTVVGVVVAAYDDAHVLAAPVQLVLDQNDASRASPGLFGGAGERGRARTGGVARSLRAVAALAIVGASLFLIGRGVMRLRAPRSGDTAGSSVTGQPVAPPGTIAADAFARAVSAGWGAADVGGDWSVMYAPSAYSVVPGEGRLVLRASGSGNAAWLRSTSTGDVVVQTDAAISRLPASGKVYVHLAGRWFDWNNAYCALLRFFGDGTVRLSVVLRHGTGENVHLGAEQVFSGWGIAGQPLRIKFETVGSGTTRLRAKVWPVSGPEPAAWQIATSDSTADLQGRGSVGVGAYTSRSNQNLPVSVTFSNFSGRAALP